MSTVMFRDAVCGVCSAPLGDEVLLKFDNMPAAAQHLPETNSLKDDVGKSLVVSQCPSCGLVQLKNQPVSYYREVIRAAAFSSEMKEFRIKQFSEFIKKYSLAGKRAIEIGCGRGEYLSIISQLDLEAHGLEYSEDSVNQCLKNGLNVQAGFVKDENYKIDGAPFDAFFILSFLEHLPDPKAALKGINNNLKDGAVGIIEVPNFNMILKKKLFSEFIMDHLFYFTKDTLKTTLKLSGFEVLECNQVWHDYIISATVRKRSRLNLSDFYDQQMMIKNKVEAYIAGFKNKGVAIWGAGHQAFAIISLLNLADKIKYVVDSAPFKQGKYTPASHLPIVSPDKFFADSIEAVIIMAGSYSDEVARTIRQKYKKNINVIILRDYGLEKSNIIATDLVSIIVPIYNSERDLPRCIESAINQSYKKIEIILINDGSTDNSGRICEKYARNDRRIKVIYTKNNGFSAARNIGIDNSKGEFMFFLDSDDFIENNAINLLIENYNRCKADIIIGDFNKINDNSSDSGYNRFFSGSKLFGKQDIIDYVRRYLKKPNKFPLLTYCWGKLFKSSIIKNNNIYFDADLHTFEDIAFNFDYLNYTDKIFFLKEVIYNYLIHNYYSSASMAIGDNPEKLFGYRYALDRIKDFIENCNSGVDMRKEVGHTYVTYTIVQLVRTCGQVNNSNKEKIYKFIYEIINDSNLRDNLQFYSPLRGDSRILPILMKLKLTWPIMWICKHKAYKRYKKP